MKAVVELGNYFPSRVILALELRECFGSGLTSGPASSEGQGGIRIAISTHGSNELRERHHDDF